VVIPIRSRLVRVYVHCADYVDGMQFEYEREDGVRGFSPFVGGVGGTRRRFDLAEDDEMIGLAGSFGRFVHSLRFLTRNEESPCFGSAGGERFEVEFGSRYGFRGVWGREGLYLDALGVVLETRTPPARESRSPVPVEWGGRMDSGTPGTGVRREVGQAV